MGETEGNKMKIGVYAGTFDPITNGHIDVINRALKLFDEVIVAVGENPQKKPLFSQEERIELIRNSLNGMKGVKVEEFNGLLAEYMKKKGLMFLVRGLRAISDFEGEFQQAIMNKKLGGIETVFFMTSTKYFYLNSTTVKEVVKLGGSMGELVPEEVENALKKKFLQ